MLRLNCHGSKVKYLLSSLIIIVLSWGLVSCSDSIETNYPAPPKPVEKFAEVAPPALIRQLSTNLEQYQPQVTILSPEADEMLESTSVEVKLQVQDLPVFKNKELGLGPHLHLILDNQPYRAVYNAQQPVVFDDLEPGTHTLRVFASRPWHESFKNEGAFAQTTFHLFTETDDNNPDPHQPLLTYSRPNGSYGAEPIMLDFYLTNAPIRSSQTAGESSNWKIRVTANGQSFLIDSWKPIYLEGFEPGSNLIRLELIDGQGNLIDNDFNDTLRAINYEPGGEDTLSKIVSGGLTLEEVLGIVDPNYVFEPNQPISEAIPLTELDTSKTELLPGEKNEPAVDYEPLENSELIEQQEDLEAEQSIIEPIEVIEDLEAEQSIIEPIEVIEDLKVEQSIIESIEVIEDLEVEQSIIESIETPEAELLTTEKVSIQEELTTPPIEENSLQPETET